MKKVYLFVLAALCLLLLLASCGFPGMADTSLEGTRMALAVQQTSMALEQTRVAMAGAPQELEPVEPAQPTYTAYPTYTSQAPEPVVEEVVTEAPEPAQSFEDWLDDADILLYDAMLGRGDTPVIENAIDGLGLGSNTKNVGTAIGDFLSQMNSAVTWDLIIVGSEYRSQVQGEIFDALANEIDRGSSVVLETWYIDQVYNGRIQPVMQRCGITFHQDWWRAPNANLNTFLVYLLEPDADLFSQPNMIGMLIPYDTRWIEDVGDTVELVPGSDAVLMAGRMPKEHNSYGLLTECMGGRIVWQTFSTHDYKDSDMLSLWQNYIYNALEARYEYLQSN